VSLNEARRRSIRLRDFDYSRDGAYFVTICTKGRELFLQEPVIHKIASDCWKEISNHFPNVEADEWVVMPNHVHGILLFAEGRGVQLNAPTRHAATSAVRNADSAYSFISPRRGTLGVIIRTYKAAVTSLSHRRGYEDFAWQRNYYEYIIRDEPELSRVREYIRNNPQEWESDENHPANIKAAVGTTGHG